MLIIPPSPTLASPSPPSCSNQPTPTPDCLGVVDGYLASCVTPGQCISTQNDDPTFWIAPWEYDSTSRDGGKEVMERLRTNIEMREDFKRVVESDRERGYLRVEFKDPPGGVSDGEFLMTQGDCTIQVRINGRGGEGESSTMIGGDIRDKIFKVDQRKRASSIRLSSGFSEIPVLRNRRRALVFIESPWDTFGPSSTFDQNAREYDPMTKEWDDDEGIKRFLRSEADDRVRSK